MAPYVLNLKYPKKSFSNQASVVVVIKVVVISYNVKGKLIVVHRNVKHSVTICNINQAETGERKT